MSTDPVNQRFRMTQEQFNGLSESDQMRVVNAKLCDKMVRPCIDRAIAQMKKSASKKDEE